ncbi:MAG: hypothetical protein GY929_13920 [Actinomycetia bacterium]|nr:hypothetical protein [Actinomycetes bacterium]
MGAKPEITPPSFSAAPALGPRVLVEASEWARGTALVHGLEELGIEAVVCGGPEGHDLRCPFVAGGGCVALGGADAAVFMVRLNDVRNVELLHRLRAARPELPLVVATPPPLAERHAEMLAGTTVVEWAAPTAVIAAAVADLVDV